MKEEINRRLGRVLGAADMVLISAGRFKQEQEESARVRLLDILMRDIEHLQKRVAELECPAEKKS